ncbi:hypothetical protein O0I10_001016 [Lichtheimia ornata]|uniref:WW domain-containing protein n=1 Tax=Lichtheimia ornata TaxID=688661 RepID=A0AAD7Y301_9FUNG|nr:uncharacterized protein O0I10_001016 [Lichtheimia ornata]KAJ8662840.1 hypothetical protein O0I10_001016 [Lichtheimia ornata]
MDSNDDRKQQEHNDPIRDQEEVNASGSEKPVDPSASDADRSSHSKEEEEKKETTGGVEEQEQDENTNDNASNVWTAAWDENSQAYYWWNMMTYETTWDNPYEKNALDKVLDQVDAQQEESGSTAASSPSTTQQQQHAEAYQHSATATPTAATPSFANQSYTYQAYFNKRTGKFQLASDVDRLNPERMSIENRAKRQMQYYFDVDAYTEERNRERAAGAAGQKRQLSKKDIERFKRAKHEKKMKRARDWLCD